MNYNSNNNECQLTIEDFLDENVNYLHLPCCLEGFTNTKTDTLKAKSGRDVFCFYGILEINEEERICEKCGAKMEDHSKYEVTLRHLCIGSTLSCLCFPKRQLFCTCCKNSKVQTIPFKADNHRITKELLQYTKDLLATNKYTNKQIF